MQTRRIKAIARIRSLSTIAAIALSVLTTWAGPSFATGPSRLFLSHGCGSTPCLDFTEVYPGTLTEAQRSIVLGGFVNNAWINVQLSNRKAIARVKWHTFPESGTASTGSEIVELQDIASIEYQLIRIPTGTGEDHNFFLLVAKNHPNDFKEILGEFESDAVVIEKNLASHTP